MSRFLKLTTRVINISHIQLIRKMENQYDIYLNDMDISGFLICGSGAVGSQYAPIKICKKKDEDDYITITKWIDSLPGLPN